MIRGECGNLAFHLSNGNGRANQNSSSSTPFDVIGHPDELALFRHILLSILLFFSCRCAPQAASTGRVINHSQSVAWKKKLDIEKLSRETHTRKYTEGGGLLYIIKVWVI